MAEVDAAHCRRPREGDIDAVIREIADGHEATLLTSDAVQAEVDEIRKAVEEEERYRPEALIKLISSLYLSSSSAMQSWVSLKCMPRLS